MVWNPFVQLSTVPAYLGWFGICIALLLVFAVLYCLITPKNEMALIRRGSTTTAVSLSGALIGFSIMMAAVMLNAVNRTDLVLWTLCGLIVQLFAYFFAAILLCGVRQVRAKMTRRFEDDDIASGIFVAGVSISVGIISAAVMAS